MTTITVLAGARTIGGTLILVEDNNSRLLFDCGLAYDPASHPFTHVRYRRHHALSDLIALRMVPRVPGFFDPSALDRGAMQEGRVAQPGQSDDAVAVSHAHLDHTALLGVLNPAVPAYMTAPTSRLVQAFAKSGAIAGGKISCRLAEATPTKAIRLGTLSFRFVPVDHDVPGACGLLIETPDGVIAYSGDLRLHGAHPEFTRAFASAARAAGARLLIMEGTTLRAPAESSEVTATERPLLRETEVAPGVADLLRANPRQQAIILLSPENGERVEAMAQASAEAGRLFVIDRDGLALATAALGRPLATPYAIYQPSQPQNDDNDHPIISAPAGNGADIPPRQITPRDIAADPGSFLLRLPFRDFSELIDMIDPLKGGILLLSNGIPLGPFDPAWGHLEWWANRLGLHSVDVASSGHATPNDLSLIAAEVGAETVMVIHSFAPEQLVVPGSCLLIPELERPYTL